MRFDTTRGECRSRDLATARRIVIWRAWAETFWPWIPSNRELFPFIHGVYNLHMTPDDLRGGFARAWRHVTRGAPDAPSGAPAPDYSPCDVIFVALGNRANCVGVGRRLNTEIRQRQLPMRLAYFQSAEEPIVDPATEPAGCVVTMRRHVRRGWGARLSRLMGLVCRVGLHNATIREFLVRHPLAVMMTMLKAIVRCDSADRVLAETGAKVVIAGNEGGVSSGGAALFSVAKQRGVRTVQYLHGMPNPMWFPFLSDEFWVWSDHTVTMFRRQGASEDLLGRMMPIGSLEYDDAGESPGMSRADGAGDAGRRVLLFSQLGCDAGWGTRAFGGMAKQVANAVAGIGDLRVRIRLHVNERANEAAKWTELLQGVAMEISPRGTALADDVAWCTHAYSNGSTAILAALKAGKASYVIWDDALNEIHGCPPFPEPYVLRTPAEIRASLTRPWRLAESASILDTLANPRGAIDRALDRMRRILHGN